MREKSILSFLSRKLSKLTPETSAHAKSLATSPAYKNAQINRAVAGKYLSVKPSKPLDSKINPEPAQMTENEPRLERLASLWTP